MARQAGSQSPFVLRGVLFFLSCATSRRSGEILVSAEFGRYWRQFGGEVEYMAFVVGWVAVVSLSAARGVSLGIAAS
jgi:hypothetical protein